MLLNQAIEWDTEPVVHPAMRQIIDLTFVGQSYRSDPSYVKCGLGNPEAWAATHVVLVLTGNNPEEIGTISQDHAGILYDGMQFTIWPSRTDYFQHSRETVNQRWEERLHIQLD